MELTATFTRNSGDGLGEPVHLTFRLTESHMEYSKLIVHVRSPSESVAETFAEDFSKAGVSTFPVQNFEELVGYPVEKGHRFTVCYNRQKPQTVIENLANQQKITQEEHDILVETADKFHKALFEKHLN